VHDRITRWARAAAESDERSSLEDDAADINVDDADAAGAGVELDVVLG
jgi:hypothetical protein